MTTHRISCVIPCYKSHDTIEGVVDEIEKTVLEHEDGTFTYEIILVNDGSPDNTMEVLRDLATTHENVIVVNLARNFGQHAAIMAGFRQVTGDIVLVLDDDGQTPACEMFELIDKCLAGYDIAYASYAKRQFNAFRNLGSKFNTWCNHHFMGIPKDLQITSYFACQRFVVDNALNYHNPYPFIGGLLFQSVKTYVNVPIEHRSRETGESGYNLRKLISLWSNGFTAFSVLPLRIMTVTGGAVSLIGFITVIVLIIRRLVNPAIDDGWTSIMALILIIGGILMLGIGLMGEYIGRIYISLNNLPQYVVRETLDHRGDAPHALDSADAVRARAEKYQGAHGREDTGTFESAEMIEREEALSSEEETVILDPVSEDVRED